MKFRYHIFSNFFVYGVLYYTVQLCRAAISMLVFLPQSHSVKLTANTISGYLAQFLLGLPYLVLVGNLVFCIFCFFETLRSFTKEMKK